MFMTDNIRSGLLLASKSILQRHATVYHSSFISLAEKYLQTQNMHYRIKVKTLAKQFVVHLRIEDGSGQRRGELNRSAFHFYIEVLKRKCGGFTCVLTFVVYNADI